VLTELNGLLIDIYTDQSSPRALTDFYFRRILTDLPYTNADSKYNLTFWSRNFTFKF